MTNRGLKCPLNGAGLKIISRGSNVEELTAFISRVVEDLLKGKTTSKDALYKYAKVLLQGEHPKGLTIDWDDFMIEVSQRKWVEGATLPETLKKSLRKKSDETEAVKERATQAPSKSDKGHGATLNRERMAAIRAKLKAGDLTTGAGSGADGAKEEIVQSKDDKRKAAFDSALKSVLSTLSKELGGKISESELTKASRFGRVNPRIRFLTKPGEYSDLFNNEFGPKFEAGELERVNDTLKKIARNRKSVSKPKASTSSKPKASKEVDAKQRKDFDSALKTLLSVLSKDLGGKLEEEELSKASPMGRINPRIRFLLKPGEYSDLLNTEFGVRLETGELRRIVITLKKVAQLRKNTPKKSQEKKAKSPQKPMTCVITRNADVFRNRCKAVGVKVSESQMQKLLGSKHVVSQFEDDKALVKCGSESIWVPDSEVLIKLGAPRKAATPSKSSTSTSDALKPLKRAPESPRSNKSTKTLEDKIGSLERDLVIAEKQKEIYRNELATLKARSGKIQPSKAASNEKNSIALISKAEFEQKVNSFPRSVSKLMVVPCNDANGMEKVHLFVYLDSEAKPALSFEMVHPDAKTVQDLACTIALKRLQEHPVFRKHFT